MTQFPWQVDPQELFALRGHGGQLFSDFVSALLRAEAAAAGVKTDDVETNTRVNIGDGGVDAEIKVAIGGPLEISVPSAWQFKATSFTEVSKSNLLEEANKPESKRLIEAGYSYYVCVCDDAPPRKMGELDSTLLEIVRAISPAAAAPRVLNCGHLADWTNRHPSIVLRFFRQQLGEVLAYDRWLRMERACPDWSQRPWHLLRTG